MRPLKTYNTELNFANLLIHLSESEFTELIFNFSGFRHPENPLILKIH
jgi:hypothetical protein